MVLVTGKEKIMGILKKNKENFIKGREGEKEKKTKSSWLLSPWRLPIHPMCKSSSKQTDTECMLQPGGLVFPVEQSLIFCLVFIYLVVLVENRAPRNILPGAGRIQQGDPALITKRVLAGLAFPIHSSTSAIPRAAAQEGTGLGSCV